MEIINFVWCLDNLTRIIIRKSNIISCNITDKIIYNGNVANIIFNDDFKFANEEILFADVKNDIINIWI